MDIPQNLLLKTPGAPSAASSSFPRCFPQFSWELKIKFQAWILRFAEILGVRGEKSRNSNPKQEEFPGWKVEFPFLWYFSTPKKFNIPTSTTLGGKKIPSDWIPLENKSVFCLPYFSIFQFRIGIKPWKINNNNRKRINQTSPHKTPPRSKLHRGDLISNKSSLKTFFCRILNWCQGDKLKK